MTPRRAPLTLILFLALCFIARSAEPPKPDERPAEPGEWGFRPADGTTLEVNPPAFVWRPQKGAETYLFECSPTPDFSKDVYRIENLWLNCHCPPEVFPAGRRFWRFAYVDSKGVRSPWSQVRSFTIPAEAVEFSLPAMTELLSRVPKQHPRLFIRPEELDQLRRDVRGPLRSQWQQLVKQANRLVANPPPSDEPLKYEPGWKLGNPQWLERWWGNRMKVIATLDGAATLAFVYMVTGERQYGEAARKLMVAAAEWDPKGSTNHIYNDEASMPVLYLMSRAYTWGYGALSDDDRAKIRASMTARGQEIFNYLRRAPHTWRPYDSHRNRGWHKLGEVAIAFMAEIDDAPKWLEHTVNVFFCCYPVWSDDDGGWHEGTSYWNGYMTKQTWWLDVMKSALRIDGYRKPYFSRAGYFPLYSMPPGTTAGGFSDSQLEREPRSMADTVAVFARGAQNGHWQWWADRAGYEREGGYLGVIRARQPAPKPKSPDDLPQSKVFRGTGLAMLHSDLTDAKKDIEIFFKSSPMGSHSHGFNVQNSYVLAVYGKPVLVWTGRRDWHGSPHHTQWMWEAKSQNSILVNGKGPKKHASDVGGKIAAFHTSREFDYVVGDATDAYVGALKQFTRTILFAKPDIIVMYDQLVAPQPATYSWLMHANEKMEFRDQAAIVASNGDSHARVSLLEPRGLRLDQNDRFDPEPQKWPGWKQWHFSAETPQPLAATQFVSVIRPYAGAAPSAANETARRVDGGWLCEIAAKGGEKVLVLLRSDADAKRVSADGDFSTDGVCAAVRLDKAGKLRSAFSASGRATYKGQTIERTDRPLR